MAAGPEEFPGCPAAFAKKVSQDFQQANVRRRVEIFCGSMRDS